MYSKPKYESISVVNNNPESLLKYRSEQEIEKRKKLKNEESAENAEIFIKAFQDIQDNIYHKLKAKHDKIFSNEVLPQLDKNTQEQLVEIKKDIEDQYSKKQHISLTLLYSLYEDKENISKDPKRLADFMDHQATFDFLREFPIEKLALSNCGENALFINKILNEKKIKNFTLNASPDHSIPIFQLGEKVYFYDLWFGGLIGKFEPNFFYKYCYSGGMKDFKIICNGDSKNITPRFQKILKQFQDFQETEKFKKIFRNKVINVLKNLNDVHTLDGHLIGNIKYLISNTEFNCNDVANNNFAYAFVKKHHDPIRNYIMNSEELIVIPENERQINQYQQKINNALTYNDFIELRNEEVRSWNID